VDESVRDDVLVLPPTTREADYRLRIFTPGGELPFAGHPTLGSAHAWLELGGAPKTAERLIQECGAGLVEVRRRTGAVPGGYRVSQGGRLDRAGDVTITADPDGAIWAGGNTSTLFHGTAYA
jgi:predicted PhzF superfamily epimerase YddE/YHI9